MLARQRPILKKLPIAGSVRIPERVHAAPHVHLSSKSHRS
jgi:hypothetical protein